MSGDAATYRAIIAAVSAGNITGLDQLIGPDLVDHNAVPGQPAGLEGFKYWALSARSAFPDLTGTVEDTLAEDDKVAGRVTYRGTHLVPRQPTFALLRGVRAAICGVVVVADASHRLPPPPCISSTRTPLTTSNVG